MPAQARWNLVVSQDTDNDLRQFLASQGRARKGELSRFVEEAVRARIFEAEAAHAKEKNRGRSLEEIQQAVDEALEWARRG
jgi:Ribbon-helix-helix domain